MSGTLEMEATAMSTTSTYTTCCASLPILPFIVAAASLGGLIFGYDLGVISAALPQLVEEFGLTNNQQEMVVSFLYIGCCVGAIIGGYLCDAYGRKRMILVTDVVFVIGANILFWATEFRTLLVGRFFMGCAVAVSGVADVAYLHEVSPIQYRGAIVSCNEACISAGFMISYLSGYWISVHNPDEGWRIMFLLGGFIAIIQFVCMLFMPESPVWLEQKGRAEMESVVQVHVHVSNQDTNTENCYFDADTLAADIVASPTRRNKSLVGDMSLNPSSGMHQHNKNVLDELSPDRSLTLPFPSGGLSTPGGSNNVDDTIFESFTKYHRQVIITIFLSTMQNWCGHPNVLNFAPQIFAQIGFDSDKGRLISTSFVGIVSNVANTTCVI